MRWLRAGRIFADHEGQEGDKDDDADDDDVTEEGNEEEEDVEGALAPSNDENKSVACCVVGLRVLSVTVVIFLAVNQCHNV